MVILRHFKFTDYSTVKIHLVSSGTFILLSSMSPVNRTYLSPKPDASYFSASQSSINHTNQPQRYQVPSLHRENTLYFISAQLLIHWQQVCFFYTNGLKCHCFDDFDKRTSTISVGHKHNVNQQHTFKLSLTSGLLVTHRAGDRLNFSLYVLTICCSNCFKIPSELKVMSFYVLPEAKQ